MPIIYLETLNIEKGQIDPKHNRRVKSLLKWKTHFSNRRPYRYDLNVKMRIFCLI